VPFKGNILFFSNRYGGSALLLLKGSPPWNVLSALTGTTLYDLAEVRDEYDPGRTLKVWYPTDANGVQQVGYVDLQAGWVKQVTNLAHGVAYDAAWSPDGSKIAYVSTETGGDEIYVYDRVSNTTRRVTFSDGLGFPWNKRPSWSADGSMIAFMSNRDTGHWQIWVVNSDGSGLQNVSDGPYSDMYPVWVKDR
jgi:Tol biopolymer transport system component